LSALRRFAARLRRPVKISRQRGIALIIVSVVIAMMTTLVAEFSYNARVDLEAAANGRDQLRAEYLARSAIALGRLIIKTQQSVFDPNRKFLGDAQLADYAPYLIRAFGGDKDERDGLGSLLGIDASGMKGMGAGKGATFDLALTSDDGRLNLNCGAGLNDLAHQNALYGVLSALLFPQRYDRLFNVPDQDGQLSQRSDVAIAILDWADIDETRYQPAVTGKPASSGTTAEDYRYDASKDPYRAHDNFYDTVDELHLVRGVSDDLYGSLADFFTVYGGCKINLGAIKPESWPLVAAIIRGTVTDKEASNPILLDDMLLAALSQRVIAQSQLFGGFQSVQDFITLVGNPSATLNSSTSTSSTSTSTTPTTPTTPPTTSTPADGIPLDPAKVGAIAVLGPRRIYRLDAIGLVERTKERKVQVHIRAVWDSAHYNQNTTSSDPNDRQGTWLYYRLD
jgi:general secretion pathway protein K